MSDDSKGIPSRNRAVQQILLFSLIVLLPGLQNSFFGWMHFIIPFTVFFYLYKWRFGFRYILAGLGIAGLASLPLGALGGLVFSVTFIPAGYILAQSAFQSDGPAWSGLKGALSLAGCWLLLVVGVTVVSGANPITEFLGSLDRGVEEALDYYRQSEAVTPDTMALLEQSFYQMKTVLPKILPSVILGLALIVVWVTMLTGNRFVAKTTGYQPWPDHQTWQLPDRLIWAFIGAALLALLPLGSLRIVGINALIAFGLIYFFQGFSILVFYLRKWNIPLLLRAFFYGMMLFQSFGTILLLVIGIGDVWFDLRRLKRGESGGEET